MRMRILSFTKMWDKLGQNIFTTFRFPRKDKDWQKGEIVRVFYKQRSPERRELGIAEIIDKKPTWMRIPSDIILPSDGVSWDEAKEDGFKSPKDMISWMEERYGDRIIKEAMNKLTLKWIKKEVKA